MSEKNSSYIRLYVMLFTTDSQLPQSWDPMNASESFKQVALSPTCTEYQDVVQNMKSTAGNSLHRIISVNAYLLFSATDY